VEDSTSLGEWMILLIYTRENIDFKHVLGFSAFCLWKVKVKLSLKQAVEAHRVVRG
jgi:hypothetical protein